MSTLYHNIAHRLPYRSNKTDVFEVDLAQSARETFRFPPFDFFLVNSIDEFDSLISSGIINQILETRKYQVSVLIWTVRTLLVTKFVLNNTFYFLSG